MGPERDDVRAEVRPRVGLLGKGIDQALSAAARRHECSQDE